MWDLPAAALTTEKQNIHTFTKALTLTKIKQTRVSIGKAIKTRIETTRTITECEKYPYPSYVTDNMSI